MQLRPSQSSDGKSAGTILKTLLVFCAFKKKKKKALLSLRRKKKKTVQKNPKQTMNDFISWTLPNLWDISEVIIEVWLIRQQ